MTKFLLHPKKQIAVKRHLTQVSIFFMKWLCSSVIHLVRERWRLKTDCRRENLCLVFCLVATTNRWFNVSRIHEGYWIAALLSTHRLSFSPFSLEKGGGIFAVVLLTLGTYSAQTAYFPLHLLQLSCCFIIMEQSTAKVAKFNPSPPGKDCLNWREWFYFRLFSFTFLIYTFLDKLLSLVQP